jgi:hypothetical protein
MATPTNGTSPDCCPVEQLERQNYLERLYAIDGRHDPEHPSHGLYTNLLTERTAQLLATDRTGALSVLGGTDDDAPLFETLIPYIGRGLIEDPDAARAICAAWCRGTAARLHWALRCLGDDETTNPAERHPVLAAGESIKAWMLHEAMRAELGQ